MIDVRNLTKVFNMAPGRARRALDTADGGAQAVRDSGGAVAVDDVSFSVERGELFAVMGLSGSGKSTVVRMINRLVEPTAGTVAYEGADVGSMTPEKLRELRNRRISMVFQHFALFPHRTVRENTAYGLKARGVARSERLERADKALEQVGLAHRGDAYPDEFSGGMKQRVGLARALATDPDVLIMDEPFSALDPLTRRSMQEQLLELQQDLGKTIIFVTHDLNEAMRIGDRIMVMKDGRVVQLATGPEIISRPATDYVRDFVSDVDRTRGLTAGAVMQRPWATAGLGEHPQQVLDRLADVAGRCAYVTGDDGRIAGVATTEALTQAVRRDRTDLGDCVADEYTAVTDDTPVVEFCHLTGGHRVPLAVVDGGGHLVGVVPRSRVLNAIAASEEVSEHA
ncbi:quaternary amine ABC transporter ATP-binding protein [Streptomonospora litoralis]|uniref:Glycine betaine transport ATP-binding protein OpuAA n=1 Tax=Streptomonospora litoralis TaxID=2498135 RepID=A0A4P6PZ85_9ACTN|nr:betaine/proline/choline family ABC transporter ATP-binding protein [Streptomonospora litoralis]QBI53626.1 Glycine betaine transport ATP-binding protein OpuAA [Streptomonospora litoralis]